MSSFADAWLLEFDGGHWAAVATKELQEVLVAPRLTRDPSAPVYCRHTIDWRGVRLPVMDLAAVFGAQANALPPRWLTVAAYRNADDTAPRFGALQLARPPVAIRVTDDMACPLPETSLPEYLAWSYLALSCFRHAGRAVPILDIGLLFSAQAQQRLQRYSAHRSAARADKGSRSMKGLA
jgi:hypothetical protein